MDHLNSIRAALRANCPVVAVPVEGHAPICVRANLLKGALKGVIIDSVEVLPNRWLKIKGHAGFVHTSSSFAPIDRRIALQEIGEWRHKEILRRKKVALQGVLSASEQRAMKLKAAEKAGIAELIQAQREEKEILAAARAHSNPALTPVDTERRQDIIGEYAAFRAQRGNRKRGAVIRWKLTELRKQKAAMVKEERTYEEKPYTVSPFARRRKVLVGTKIVLRRKKDAIKYAAVIYQIGRLEKQYNALYPADCRESWDGSTKYYTDSWITKKPREQTYYGSHGWRDRVEWDKKDEDRQNDVEYNRERLRRTAEHLKNVRGDIRALTPPEDELTEDMPIAA
jgi:hypothetical protein